MSTSYLETVYTAFSTKLKTIDAGATFRNTVYQVYEDFRKDYPDYPSIVLKFGPMRLKSNNSAWSVYDVYISFGIFCQIKANTATDETSTMKAAQDSLVHDVLRCIAELYTENIVAASGARWNVQNDPPIEIMPVLPVGQNTGEFAIYGWLHIRNLDKSFDD